MRRASFVGCALCIATSAEAAERAPRWITLTARQDLSVLGTSRACSPESQAAGELACFRSDDTQYLGNLANQPRVRGLALATTRVMVGYQHFVTPRIALAGRLGWAFRGGPKPIGAEAHAFLPLHVSAHLSAWPWAAPQKAGAARPFVSIGGGLGQVDASASVRVREDRSAPPSPAQLDNADQQTLTAWQKAGVGFAEVSVGGALALHRHWLLTLAVLGRVSFPAPGVGGGVEAGVAFDP